MRTLRTLAYDPYSALNQKLIDAGITGIAFYLAYQLRFDWHVPPTAARQMWTLLVPVMLGRLSLNILLRTYRMIWRYVDLSDAVTVARNCAAFSLLLVLFQYWLRNSTRAFDSLQIPFTIVVLEGLLSLVGALTARALRRLHREGLKNGSKGTPVLLVGAGRAGVMVAKQLRSRPDLRLLGFLDDDPKKIGAVVCGLRVLGPLPALSLKIQQHQAREVIICIPHPPRKMLKRIWAVCEQLAVRVQIVPTLEEILRGKVNIANFREVEMKDLLGREPIDLAVEHAGLADSYSNKTILITGAGGSIGSELAFQLARLKPKQLILLDKDENGLHDTSLRLQKDAGGILSLVVADIRFPQRIQSVFSSFRPEVVFHAAAHKHVHLMEVNPCEAIANNVSGTRNLVEQAVRSGVSRFVQISTDKAVNPTSIMGASKRLCEMIVQSSNVQSGNGHHQTRFCCVRFGNVLGSRGSVVPIFQQQIAEGGPVTVTHPGAQRFLMTIPEAVCLLIEAGTLANAGEIFVLDMGKPVFIEHLARNLIEHSGLRPGKDVQIEITELHPGEKLSEVLVDDLSETLQSTLFEKISMISSQPFDIEEFKKKLADLEEAAWQGSTGDSLEILRDLNIGFRSAETSPAQVEQAPVKKAKAHAVGV
jgi:FlaA1/EpsC-like NDP-sugar epimerase